MKTSEEPIIIEESFNAAAVDLWSAITDPDHMRQWYFEEISSFSPELGSKTSFIVHADPKTFTHLWEVSESILYQKISYKWRYEEYPGDSVVTFEIGSEGDQSNLTVTHKVLEDFPHDMAEFERESGVQGWIYFIKNKLKSYMDD